MLTIWWNYTGQVKQNSTQEKTVLAEKTDTPENTDTNGPNRQQEFILVQVALRLFHEKGYDRVKFSDIARAAGVTIKEAQEYFADKTEICHQVIESHLNSQSTLFADIDRNSNPRQRLSHLLDNIADNTDILMSRGCPLTNLYFDIRRGDKQLARQATSLMRQRLDWISRQFVLITRVEGTTDYAERLASAIIGISILAEVSGNDGLIRRQVNQLKSWIRSM